jgi:hypothetical protein
VKEVFVMDFLMKPSYTICSISVMDIRKHDGKSTRRTKSFKEVKDDFLEILGGFKQQKVKKLFFKIIIVRSKIFAIFILFC